MCACVRVCENQNVGTDPRIPALRGGNFNQTPYNRPLGDIAGCKALKSDVRRGPMMQKPLSGTLDHQEFLRVKNRNNGNPGENTPESPPGQHTRSPRVRASVEVKSGRCDIRDHGKAPAKVCEVLCSTGPGREGVRRIRGGAVLNGPEYLLNAGYRIPRG